MEEKKKEGRENEREGEREERRGRERRMENGENGTRNVPPSPGAFPSTKLGNNITPIKGRLGKNTTPTSRGPIELNQNPQADHRRRRSSLDASFHVDLSYTPGRAKSQSMSFIATEPPFIRRLKHSETCEIVSNSP